mgnify:CR=1 FL=1
MSSSEIIDILDSDGSVIGTTSREEAERYNHATENVLVFVFNSLGRVWVQLRPMNKNHYPGLWDISACGGVLSDETTMEAAIRETKEETGLDVDLTYVDTFLNIFPGDSGEERRRISSLYIGFSNEQPKINEEVDEFKEWDPSELRSHVIENESLYIPSFVVELDMAIRAVSNLKLIIICYY